MGHHPLRDLSAAQLAELCDIYVQLSPENLTCDGELPPAEVRRRKAELTERLRRLQSLAGLSVNDVTETVVVDEWRARGCPR